MTHDDAASNPHEKPATSRSTLIKAILLFVLGIGVPFSVFVGVVIARGGKTKFDAAQPRMVDRMTMRLLSVAVQRYRTRLEEAGYGKRLPATLDELIIGPSDWRGRWNSLLTDSDVPRDPWTREYGWKVLDEAAGRYEIRSYGRDGRPGGSPPFDDDLIERSTD
ncbi:MAG: type II secretion system protein GspG [Planctomycetota bacterium]